MKIESIQTLKNKIGIIFSHEKIRGIGGLKNLFFLRRGRAAPSVRKRKFVPRVIC